MGRTESVKEMHERHPSADRCQMSHAGQIHYFLHAAGTQLGKPGGTAVHGIGMISEDRQRMASDCTGCHMQDSRKPLTGDPVHGRDHQHQSLGRCKARCKSTCLERSVYCRDRPGFRLHLYQLHALSEQIFLSFC